MATTKATDIRRKNEVKCAFISVWDDDVVLRSRAIYHKNDGSVEVLETHDISGLHTLDRQYIEFPDGDEMEVCPVCNEYVLKTAMVPGIGHDLNEDKECSNPDCENKA